MPDLLRIAPGETLHVRERTPAVLVLEATYAPNGSPPPTHYHTKQDEHFEILERTLRVEVAGEQRDLRAGDTSTSRVAPRTGCGTRTRSRSAPAGRPARPGGSKSGSQPSPHCLALADAPYPQPGARPAEIRRYFEGSAAGARISIAGQLLSAASPARFTATVAGLARESRSRPLPVAAAGGLAAGSLAVSALTSLALTGGAARNKATAVALHRRLFVAGGPVHTAAFGALAGRLSLAGRRSGRLPRGLTGAGLVSAGFGALSPVCLIAESAVWLIPAGRVTGLVVAGVAGARLSRQKP